MSNDLRGVLRSAATVPVTDADVAGAWRRGRHLRARRLAAGGLAILAVVAIGSVAVVNALPDGHGTTPAGPVPTTIAATCTPPSTTSVLPKWTDAALSTNRPGPSSIPHLISPDGNVAAVLFGSPLQAGVAPADLQNKILWIMRLPRDGKRLAITATLPGSDAKPVHLTFPANSGPGQIYPSGDDVPVPGCWHFALAWNGHHSEINLRYIAAAPAPTVPTVSPTTPVTTKTLPPSPTTCDTASLTVTLGPPNGSAGHENYELAFRNDGPTTCTMTGFPGVSFLDGSGNQIGDPAQRNPILYTTVSLTPGASGYAHLAVTDPSVLSGCPATPAAKIRIYPPNETAPVLIAAGGITVCATQPGATIDPMLDHSLG